MSWLHNSHKEIVLVTSGAVAFGKQRMRQERFLSQSVRSALLPTTSAPARELRKELEPRACAAAGQAGLMALYESMFGQYGISCAQVNLYYFSHTCRPYTQMPIPLQVLLTGYDFMAPDGQQNFLHTLDCILDMKAIPILNTNDVHSAPPEKNSDLRDVRSAVREHILWYS